MIAIVDYGIGNLGSVTKGFRHAGAETVLTGDPEVLRSAAALVLPGDGAFGATMDEIRRRGLARPVEEAAARGVPVLGICIGMQVLFEESEEHGRHLGLGLLPGRVRRLPAGLPVPHMGWNVLRPRRAHPLLEGIAPGDYVYFVHSYYCDAASDVVLADTDYGLDFAAVVGRGSVLGMQFHPEKSQAVGLRLVANFVRVCSRGGLGGAERHRSEQRASDSLASERHGGERECARGGPVGAASPRTDELREGFTPERAKGAIA